MAITKILHQKASPGRELGLHTKQLIAYIINPDKTEECVLTGGINCLPETAYVQMLETKKMFGKPGGRQSYHVIISLVPGEGTPEMLYELTKKFASEFLGGEYEAVFAVHTDHEHLHSHLVFNSVNMITGKKFQYKKGDWKHKMQPITNKLSEEYSLEIMPAEYSEDPKNMSRDQWEKEKSFSEYIDADARFCLMIADNRKHFIYLMKELGYEVKEGTHIAVKAPGMKRFKRLSTIMPAFDFIDEKTNQFKIDNQYDNRLYMSIDPRPLKRAKLSPLQRKYYVRLYKMRLLEKRRFQYKSAQFYKDLQRFKQLQEEYLFLVSEDIQSIDDLVNVKLSSLHRYREISAEQKCIYRERARLKKKNHQYANSLEVVDHFDEDEYRKRLQILKELKRTEDKRFRIADKIYQDCLYNIELKGIDSISVSVFEKELDNVDIEEKIPELPKPRPEPVIESISKTNVVESDYEIEIIAVDAVIDIQEMNLSVQDFFLLSVEDKAAIWDITKYDPLDAFEAYRKVADSTQVSKSVPDLYDEFIRIKNKCLEYKKEPWEREYRKIVLKGEYNNDKRLIRTKVR